MGRGGRRNRPKGPIQFDTFKKGKSRENGEEKGDGKMVLRSHATKQLLTISVKKDRSSGESGRGQSGRKTKKSRAIKVVGGRMRRN